MQVTRASPGMLVFLNGEIQAGNRHRALQNEGVGVFECLRAWQKLQSCSIPVLLYSGLH